MGVGGGSDYRGVIQSNTTDQDIERTTPIGQMIDAYLKSSIEMDDNAIHLLFSANRWEAAYVSPFPRLYFIPPPLSFTN